MKILLNSFSTTSAIFKEFEHVSHRFHTVFDDNDDPSLLIGPYRGDTLRKGHHTHRCTHVRTANNRANGEGNGKLEKRSFPEPDRNMNGIRIKFTVRRNSTRCIVISCIINFIHIMLTYHQCRINGWVFTFTMDLTQILSPRPKSGKKLRNPAQSTRNGELAEAKQKHIAQKETGATSAARAHTYIRYITENSNTRVIQADVNLDWTFGIHIVIKYNIYCMRGFDSIPISSMSREFTELVCCGSFFHFVEFCFVNMCIVYSSFMHVCLY